MKSICKSEKEVKREMILKLRQCGEKNRRLVFELDSITLELPSRKTISKKIVKQVEDKLTEKIMIAYDECCQFVENYNLISCLLMLDRDNDLCNNLIIYWNTYIVLVGAIEKYLYNYGTIISSNEYYRSTYNNYAILASAMSEFYQKYGKYIHNIGEALYV